MSFVDSGLAFNAAAGEGCTFIDIDQDGDLDLYTNRTGNNRLYINNLGFFQRSSHIYIDGMEDRDALGLTGTEERFGVGATAKILDCDGNVISGTREVNGGYGHGTQAPGTNTLWIAQWSFCAHRRGSGLSQDCFWSGCGSEATKAN